MIDTTIEKFQQWKSIKNERASVTYGWVVKRFFKFCDKGVGEITIDDIVGYQAYLKKNYGDATQANVAQALRSFFRFTNKRGITKIDTDEITVTRVEEKVPVYVVQSEFETLCDIAKFTNPYIHLAVRLLWYTGVRVSELCDIEYDAIDLTEKCAWVRTRKAYKPKQIFWDDETNDLISGLMKSNPLRIYLFESPQKIRLSTRSMERWIAAIVKKSAIDKHITPHSFRHGATKEWLNNGVDLPAIKDLLGHRSLLSIEKYTKRLDDDIREKGREAVRQRVNSIKYKVSKILK